MFALLKSLWAYRGFVASSIRNEFAARFARSRLGGLWMIIHPLAQVAIYALILSNVLAARLPGIDNRYAYAQYLMAGILAWTLFAEIVSRCLGLFIEQGALMKKMRFPRITLPVIVVGSSLLNNLFLLLALVLVFALLGRPPHLLLAWLLPLTFACLVLALGIGLILGILNVFMRDVGQVVPIILQMWFWFTPIIYPLNVIPEAFRGLLALNPMFPIVAAYQDVLVYGRMPDAIALLWVTMAGLALMAVGLFMFCRAAPEMVDAL